MSFDSIGHMKTGAVQLIQFLLIADDKGGRGGVPKPPKVDDMMCGEPLMRVVRQVERSKAHSAASFCRL